jgi:hypothetical protein
MTEGRIQVETYRACDTVQDLLAVLGWLQIGCVRILGRPGGAQRSMRSAIAAGWHHGFMPWLRSNERCSTMTFRTVNRDAVRRFFYFIAKIFDFETALSKKVTISPSH